MQGQGTCVGRPHTLSHCLEFWTALDIEESDGEGARDRRELKGRSSGPSHARTLSRLGNVGQRTY